MCGVPYGEIDVDRLLNSLTVVRDAMDGAEIGIVEKGLSALESLLFARYQMYRNVYWHHAVRSATAMYKRLVEDARRTPDRSTRATLAGFTDEGLLHDLARRAPSPLLAALRERRLFKRAFQCPAGDLPADAAEWIADDPALTRRVEDALAAELGLNAGELLLDYPDEDADARPRHARATTQRRGLSPNGAAARARSTCRSWPRSSTGPRAGCECSPAGRYSCARHVLDLVALAVSAGGVYGALLDRGGDLLVR